jgi:hypothetical protein
MPVQAYLRSGRAQQVCTLLMPAGHIGAWACYSCPPQVIILQAGVQICHEEDQGCRLVQPQVVAAATGGSFCYHGGCVAAGANVQGSDLARQRGISKECLRPWGGCHGASW